ncbi:hydantoinase/oxoprolinase family protein [Frankia sp. Cppng1_Ct_nod]|uniref:hydantoinase/oxoprolinase family protein n=1 Tax=Frankia sp. Cppng1_Ct_nod TaxID=2897162 RepID=UPI001A9515A3|nr:hydantoinase/oxoprolinase family protein [Frankia sp. Cppng1_Ct_nod]
MGGKIVGVDVGGTFTDVVAIEDGQIRVAKVPTDVRTSETSVLRGAADVDVSTANVFNLASTAGLNAIITRRIPKVAFLTTLGHRDILDRGRLVRPWTALTDMSWRRGIGDASRPLVPRYLRRGVKERITAQGGVLIGLDEDQAREELRVLASCNVEGVAICLINSYVDGAHEQRLRELVAEELGDVVCSISSEVSPLAKEYGRASTTVVDVIMKIKYTQYTDRLGAGLHDLGFTGTFNYADCSARLMPADYAMEQPYRLVVGGPAAGTVSSAHFGRLIGDEQLICADVGGTSVDISVVIDGQPWSNSTFELEHDLVINALSTDIVTLGAGGGSIVAVTPTGEIQVGPDSAGAEPGPACYGQGGTRPTLTDTALLAGVLSADGFLGGTMILHPELAEAAFNSLDTQLSLAQRVRFAWRMGLNNVAEGLLNIAIRRGIDPRDFSLVAFGAAGPMLLPSLLDLVPLRRVIVPPHPGLFSALGLVSSDQVFSDQRSAYTFLSPESADTVDRLFREMENGLLSRQDIDASAVRIVRSFDGRLYGQSWETPFVEVPAGPITPDVVTQMIGTFHDAYERRNSNRFPAFPVQGVTFRVQMIVPSDKAEYPKLEVAPDVVPPVSGTTAIRYLLEEDVRASEYQRADLLAGHRITGPAVIRESMSTTFVPAGHTATVGEYGELSIV